MDRTKTLACLIVLTCAAGCSSSGSITVASKNFTEQVILGEITAQHLEARLGRQVDRKLNLGGTLLVHQALMNGEIDIYPEYSGTAMASILKMSGGSAPDVIFQKIREAYRTGKQVEWLDPLGFNNSFAMVVTRQLAEGESLKTLSDAAKTDVAWKLGVGYEFQTRPDGLPALNATYDLRLASAAQVMDLGLLYRALEQGQVNMIAANETDGFLSLDKFQVLQDDRNAFPPYEAALLVRQSTLERHPELKEALSELSGKISSETMRKLNYQVDGLHQPVKAVAAGFLRDAGLANSKP
ncbi:MAG: glycine betaine ABC transporter substrate-binding protein [Bryobacteraceae bacterium]